MLYNSLSADMDSETIEEICKAIITAGAVGGTVVLTPALIMALGFGAGGVAAGSLAAKLMPLFGTSWLIASLQSIGAAGFGWLGISSWGVLGAYIGNKISALCNITVTYQPDP
ncbi:interferon alpha-inducible protein 27-like protein 2 [Fundulus heteroclitus]|uniref:interferon alpha-inducible protein 27-like protein 2 n=1 Tax=Fundulus heteroclitus TaxID=8078 RepID=UPI00165C261D|nr:interferon alpha-inducible protein 27-like protein 2 [Fundulus heteroclitus]